MATPELPMLFSKVASLGEITFEKIDQGGPSRGETFTYVDIGSVDNQEKRIVELKILPVGEAPSRAKQRLRAGDVLVSMTRPNLNAVAIVPPELDGAIGSTGFHVLRAKGCDPRWLYFAVQSNSFVDAMCALVQGALYPAVRPKDIRAYEIPLPSLAEQRRVIEEIETQLSRLEAGVAGLRRAQASLRRYRAATLKAACEGRLVPTEAELARAEGRDYETGAQLLQRIAAERASAKSLRARSRSTVSSGVKDASIQSAGLNLPEGWVLGKAEEILADVRSGTTSVPTDEKSDRAVLRSSAVRPMRVDLADYRYLPPSSAKDEVTTLSQGDLLFTRLSGSREYVGVCGRMRQDIGGLHFPDRFFRARAVLPRMVAYLELAFNGPYARAQVEAAIKSTAGHQRISTDGITGQTLLIPPLAEQARIVAEVERRLSVVDSLEAAVTANLHRATRLRQAVLQAAFRPTDSSVS